MKCRCLPIRDLLTTWLSFEPHLLLIVASLLAGMGILVPRARAQDCIDYSDYLHVAGSVSIEGTQFGVAVAGGHAYVADFMWGLRIVDVKTPESPVLVAGVETPGYADDVAVAAGYAYITDSVGLHVIDIANPVAPRILSSVSTPSRASELAVAGDYVFVVAGDLQIIDVSNPALPSIVGVVALPGFEAVDVAVTGGMACLVANSQIGWRSSFFLLDISDTRVPSIAGSIEMDGQALCVAAGEEYAYVSTTYHLAVVDIASEAAPIIVGRLTGTPRDMAVSGNHVLLAGLGIVDVSDPSAPQYVGGIADLGMAVAVDRSYAFLVGHGLRTVALAHLTSVRAIASIRNVLGEAFDVAVSGDFAYIAARLDFFVVDISNPAAPLLMGRVEEAGGTGVVVAGNYAYVANRGLRAIDVTNHKAPFLAGAIHPDPPYWNCYDVAVAGEWAYVACGDDGLLAINISDPTALKIAGTTLLPGPPRGVAVAGQHAYVAALHTGLHVLDLSNPASPVVVATVATAGLANDVTVSGRYAYVADNDGIEVVDIWDPTAPAIVGSIPLRCTGNLAVYGNFAYVVGDTCGADLEILDISTPSAPLSAGNGIAPIRLAGLAATANGVFIANRHLGLDVFPAQCTDPAPELTIDVTQHPYLTQKIDCHLLSTLPLDPSTILMRIGADDLSLAAFDSEGRAWSGPFELPMPPDSASTALSIRSCASSTAGTNSCAERQLSLHFLRQGEKGVISTPDGALTIAIDGAGLTRDGYVLVMPDGIGSFRSYATSPRGFLGVGHAMIEIAYSENDVPDPTLLHIEESSLGALPSSVDPLRHIVSAVISDLGIFRLALGPGASTPERDPKFIAVEQNVPNPFNPMTTMRFEIQEQQRVRVNIYDALGRHVATVLDRVLGAGVHEVAWNGRATDGGSVASGVYIYRIETEDTTAARKMLVVR